VTFDRKVGRVNAAVYLSPHPTPDLDPEPALLELIGNAKRKIRFGVYSFTLPAVADAIVAAHTAGLDVRGVGDATAWTSVTSQYPRLVADGVDVHRWGRNYRLMHDKVLVVDDWDVALGSWNWTTQAEKVNTEVLLVVTGVQASRILAPTMTAQIEAAYANGT
jgi:phosphatidylserine/phosphatidylglycerophosphate/cardiolipin synthase-like enzyme